MNLMAMIVLTAFNEEQAFQLVACNTGGDSDPLLLEPAVKTRKSTFNRLLIPCI